MWAYMYTYNVGYGNLFSKICVNVCTVKPVLSGHSKKRPKICFQYRLSLNAGQTYCRMLPFLRYFRPSISYQLPFRSLFCLFLSGCLRQVLLYLHYYMDLNARKPVFWVSDQVMLKPDYSATEMSQNVEIMYEASLDNFVFYTSFLAEL